METPYATLPDPPGRAGCGAILSRLVDGIGFRYRWATEGLADVDLPFTPAAGCMSLNELLRHIHALLRWIGKETGIPADHAAMDAAEGIAIRSNTLLLCREISGRFARATDREVSQLTVRTSHGESFPFWYLVNGPLADALTHIGQVNSWRRIAGTPAPPADVFRGLPPEEQRPRR